MAPIPRLELADTARATRDLLGPLVARGVVIRRPRIVRALEWLDADRRAVRRLLSIRGRYGPGPVDLGLPVRRLAVVLDDRDAMTVLDGSPHPFDPASLEKRRALGHFQPGGVLISRGPARVRRRRWNEEVLDHGHDIHRLGERFAALADEEAAMVIDAARTSGHLDWDRFTRGWHRLVRRVVLGDGARDDEELTDLLAALRAQANWSFLHPERPARRRAFTERLAGHLARAEPGSLAECIASGGDGVRPDEQVPQWLFAFDPAGMTTFRTLAVLGTRPDLVEAAREEAAGDDGGAVAPHLRRCVLEALRLWPTTPAILRDVRADTSFEHGTLRSGSGVLIFTPYFHRHPTVSRANRFDPTRFLDDEAHGWPMLQFSAGPVTCPGRELVLHLTSTFLASVLRRRRPVLVDRQRLEPSAPMPGTFDHYSVRLELTA